MSGGVGSTKDEDEVIFTCVYQGDEYTEFDCWYLVEFDKQQNIKPQKQHIRLNFLEVSLWLLRAASRPIKLTRKHISRAIQVLKMIVSKRLNFDFDENAIELYYDSYFEQHSLYTDGQTPQRIIDKVFNAVGLRVFCFDVDEQDNLDFINTGNHSADEILSDMNLLKYVKYD